MTKTGQSGNHQQGMSRFAKYCWIVSLSIGLAGGFNLVRHGKFAELGKADRSPQAESMPAISVGELPQDAQKTYRLIFLGGPFPYEQDGRTFGNRERLLPNKERGYYHEYTVPTPGVSNRGGRRIVCGGEQLTRPDACYYTNNHYVNFRLIIESQLSIDTDETRKALSLHAKPADSASAHI